MKKILFVACAVLVVMALASCAPGPNNMLGTENSEGDEAGFFKGLWHGFIMLFTFIISLFTEDVNVYEVHNNGAWYNLGFLVGVMVFFGGSSRGTCRSK
jgi:hypothetical protein